MDRTEKIIAQAQGKKALRADVKARDLTLLLFGRIRAFSVSAMALENQPLKGASQKDRIERGLMEVFMNGASSHSKQKNRGGPSCKKVLPEPLAKNF